MAVIRRRWLTSGSRRLKVHPVLRIVIEPEVIEGDSCLDKATQTFHTDTAPSLRIKDLKQPECHQENQSIPDHKSDDRTSSKSSLPNSPGLAEYAFSFVDNEWKQDEHQMAKQDKCPDQRPVRQFSPRMLAKSLIKRTQRSDESKDCNTKSNVPRRLLSALRLGNGVSPVPATSGQCNGDLPNYKDTVENVKKPVVPQLDMATVLDQSQNIDVTKSLPKREESKSYSPRCPEWKTVEINEKKSTKRSSQRSSSCEGSTEPLRMHTLVLNAMNQYEPTTTNTRDRELISSFRENQKIARKWIEWDQRHRHH